MCGAAALGPAAVAIFSPHVPLCIDCWEESLAVGLSSPRHFLFKPGGTSPLFCTTSPGYPLTSSTVYSPPPRPLPRSTFSRPAFNLKKPYKYCNWKCAALSAIVISVTLVILLAYFIGKFISVLFVFLFALTFSTTSPTMLIFGNKRLRLMVHNNGEIRPLLAEDGVVGRSI